MSFKTITHKLFPGLRSSGNPRLDNNRLAQADLLSDPYDTIRVGLSRHAEKLAHLRIEEARLLGNLVIPSEVQK